MPFKTNKTHLEMFREQSQKYSINIVSSISAPLILTYYQFLSINNVHSIVCQIKRDNVVL